jgi:outer membrane protein TolC
MRSRYPAAAALQVAIALVTLAVATTRAQQPIDPSAVRLTLDAALQRALTASHRIEEARARGDAASAVVGERRASAMPQIAAVGGYTRTNHVDEFGVPLPDNQLRIIYPDIPDNYRARLDMQWPIYTSGRLPALADAARREQAAAQRDTLATTADVRLDVTRAFWTLVVARENERVVNGSLERMGEHVRDVRNQLDAGLVPPNDLLTAQAQQAHQRMLSVQAQSNREVAEADLIRLTGLDPATRVVPDAVLAPPVVDASVDTLIGEALANRPERQALEQRIAAGDLRQSAASAGHRPVVAVAAGVDYARPNPRIFPRVGEWRDSWDAGVTVSWPLFDGGRTRSEAAEAAAGTRALRARLAELDSTIALDIRQRMSELVSSHAAVAAAEASVQAATEARRVIGDRFVAGVATSTDVVDAQVAILQAELDRTQAIAAARIAEARLYRATGR